MNPMHKQKIVLIEDHPIFRLGMKELVNAAPDLVVCAEADNFSAGLKAISETAPDLAVVDIALQGRDRLDLIGEIKNRYPALPVLVVSMYDETAFVERALAGGASGYIVKQDAADTVVAAIGDILRGQMAVSEPHKSRLLQKFLGGKAPKLAESPEAVLTDRELEVFTLIGRGRATGEIARTLNLSVKTIGTYRQRIKEKLDLKNSAELLRKAFHYVDRPTDL